MSAQRTPGPYRYDKRDRTVVATEPGLPLARCYAGRNGDLNGPLFAAAPDLLEALERIFAKLDRIGGAPGHSHDVRGIWDADNAPGVAGTPCEWCAQWAAARAAIAKSRGEA